MRPARLVVFAGAVLAVALGSACSSSDSPDERSATPAPRTSSTASPANTTATSSATATRSAASPPRSSRSATSGGRLSVVPSTSVRTLPAKPLRSPAPFGDGVSLQVTDIGHGKVTDSGRGAVTGQPTVVFDLRLRNGSARRVDLDTVQITLAYGRNSTPATQTVRGTKPFSGDVRAGASASATYSFAVPRSEQDRVVLLGWYRQGAPSVLLRGSAR